MNKTEISKETKAKVYSSYLGQEIIKGELIGLLHGLVNDTCYVRYNDVARYEDVEDCTLLLTPLSKISDQDAIEVVKIMDPNAKEIYVSNGTINWEYEYLDERFKSTIEIRSIHLCAHYASCQYLQSRGYDLPNYHLNGQTLIQAGLALDKTLITK